jgi:hypothetical protein
LSKFYHFLDENGDGFNPFGFDVVEIAIKFEDLNIAEPFESASNIPSPVAFYSVPMYHQLHPIEPISRHS